MTRSPTPHALLLTPVLPARGGNGLAMRAGATLEGLARSHRVRVVVAPVLGAQSHHDDGLAAELATDVRWLDLVPPADSRAHAIELLSTAGGRERAAALPPLPEPCRALNPAAAREVARIAGGTALVWTLRLYLAPLLDALLDDPRRRPPIALDVDDRDAAVLRALDDPHEATAYERLEAHYLPRVELVTAAAPADAAALGQDHVAARTQAVPNAVRIPAEIARHEPSYDLLFVGNLTYAPNVEAARWIATELRSQLDAPRIAIAGSRPAADVLALAEHDGVDVLADVPDLGPLYARSVLALAPLSSGGGTRIKILEALAHGLPVVATRVGAEGLDLGAGDGVLVAERDGGFATACARLLADPAEARRLGSAGRREVGDRATVERVAETIDRLARSILSV